MRGRSAEMSVFNAAYSNDREFHQSLRFNMLPAASCPFCCTKNTSSTYSISSSYLSSDAESLYRNISSNPTAKTKGNSRHAAGSDDRACKWAGGGECLPDSHGKSSVRVDDFRSTEKPFNPTDRHAKIKSKPKTGKDSKKPKQPISPGKKLAKFLILLFTAGGTKKAKRASHPSVSVSTSYDSSEPKPSSAYSSFSSVQSRPCFSKTYKGRLNNRSGMGQKSVTFCPTSVNVDCDFRPYGEKCLHRTEDLAPNSNPPSYPHTHPSKGAYKLPLLEKDSHAVAAITKNIIVKSQKENDIMEAVIRSLDKEDEEEENDVASCSSSDLFELKNLADVDMNMYHKELPVYETTHWETNKAIAQGLIVG